jgi:FtsZ-binding cell division protein ZapB
MTRIEIDTFEKVQAQIEGLHIEISTLSKKSQNDALNKFKLKFVNQSLKDANAVLGEKYKPFDDFTIFEESEIPTNSDCAMMLSQYLSCFEKLRADNVTQISNLRWVWIVDGANSDIKTSIPKKILK